MKRLSNCNEMSQVCWKITFELIEIVNIFSFYSVLGERLSENPYLLSAEIVIQILEPDSNVSI